MKKLWKGIVVTLFSILGFILGAVFSGGNTFAAIMGMFMGLVLSLLWPIISPRGLRQIKEDRSKIADLEKENKSQKEQLNKKMTILQMKPEELNRLIKSKEGEVEKLENTIKEKNHEIDASKEKAEDIENQISKLNKELVLGKDIYALNQELTNLKTSIDNKKREIAQLQDQIISYNDQISLEGYGLYTPHYDFENSIKYKEKLDSIRQEEKAAIRNGNAGIIVNGMLLDGSESKGHRMQLKNIKQLIRTFNIECEAAINKATYTNMPRIEKRIKRSFEQLNKLNTSNNVKLNSKYLDLKLAELHLAFEYAAKKEEEKEKLREEREKEREEKKAQAEIARQKKAVEKERAKQAKHFEQAQALLKEKMESVNKGDEKYKSLQEEVEKLKSQLNELDKKSASLDYRENHATAGYVYIISNIGSFGKNIYKIGVTRRLEPLDRIRELSSASVPFKFDVHALIFSDDAYKLETNLHNYFDKQRVNKVNNRKEFFNITIDQIKDALNKYYNRTFDFHEIPEAEEYRKSLEIAKSLQSQEVGE